MLQESFSVLHLLGRYLIGESFMILVMMVFSSHNLSYFVSCSIMNYSSYPPRYKAVEYIKPMSETPEKVILYILCYIVTI